MPQEAHALDELRVDGAPPSDAPLNHVWNQCVGAGRANEALRADWQAQFREAVDVLGVRFVRFHGLFHDDMFVYRATYGGGFAPPEVLPEPQTPSAMSTRRSTRSSTRARARSSSWGSCPGSWPRRPRRCSGGRRTAARPTTWRSGSDS